MTPSAEGTSPVVRRGGNVGRLAALGALALVVVAIAVILFSGGDDGYKYRLLFETGGQLVKGNEVLIGGQPVGTVDEVALRDDGQAQVDITVDRELHDGTSAVIRSTSLSGIANRYVSITPGPDNADALRRRPDHAGVTRRPRLTWTSSSTPSTRRRGAASRTSSRAPLRSTAARPRRRTAPTATSARP